VDRGSHARSSRHPPSWVLLRLPRGCQMRERWCCFRAHFLEGRAQRAGAAPRAWGEGIVALAPLRRWAFFWLGVHIRDFGGALLARFLFLGAAALLREGWRCGQEAGARLRGGREGVCAKEIIGVKVERGAQQRSWPRGFFIKVAHK
jgi:hypothetical protein